MGRDPTYHRWYALGMRTAQSDLDAGRETLSLADLWQPPLSRPNAATRWYEQHLGTSDPQLALFLNHHAVAFERPLDHSIFGNMEEFLEGYQDAAYPEDAQERREQIAIEERKRAERDRELGRLRAINDARAEAKRKKRAARGPQSGGGSPYSLRLEPALRPIEREPSSQPARSRRPSSRVMEDREPRYTPAEDAILGQQIAGRQRNPLPSPYQAWTLGERNARHEYYDTRGQARLLDPRKLPSRAFREGVLGLPEDLYRFYAEGWNAMLEALPAENPRGIDERGLPRQKNPLESGDLQPSPRLRYLHGLSRGKEAAFEFHRRYPHDIAQISASWDLDRQRNTFFGQTNVPYLRGFQDGFYNQMRQWPEHDEGEV